MTAGAQVTPESGGSASFLCGIHRLLLTFQTFVSCSGEVTRTLRDNVSDSDDGFGSDPAENLFEAVFVRVDLGDYSSFLGPQMHEAQRALYRAHEEALAQTDTLRDSCRGLQKDGDGYLVWWPSDRMSHVISQYVVAFKDSLAKKNVARSPDALLRARLSVVTSLAADSALGTAGEGAVEAKRLVDCEQARWLQKEFPDQQLVVIVSQYVYEQTIRQGWAPDTDPEGYRPVVVRDKHRKERGAYITAPGLSARDVDRTLNPSFLHRMGRFLGRTVAPRARKVAQAVRWTPRLVMASLVAPAVVGLAAALLVPVAFSSPRVGGEPGDRPGRVTGTASPAPERPGPATSRSGGERPTLSPRTVPSAPAATEERGPLGNVGVGGFLGADETGARLVDGPDGARRTWRWSTGKDGSLRLRTTGDGARSPALTFDVSGRRVGLQGYADVPAQEWWVVPVAGGEGAFRLHNGARPDSCLTAQGKGGWVTLEVCRPRDPTQEWTIG